MYFQTERLTARQLKPNDFNRFHHMQSNQAVMKYILGRAKTEEENAAEFNDMISEYSHSEPDKIIMGVSKIPDSTSALIGTCAITSLKEEYVEVGYRLSEENWGNGYGGEILEGLLMYCFEDLKAKKVKAEVEIDNIPSVRILERSPMSFVRQYDDGDTVVRLYVIEKTHSD